MDVAKSEQGGDINETDVGFPNGIAEHILKVLSFEF